MLSCPTLGAQARALGHVAWAVSRWLVPSPRLSSIGCCELCVQIVKFRTNWRLVRLRKAAECCRWSDNGSSEAWNRYGCSTPGFSTGHVSQLDSDQLTHHTQERFRGGGGWAAGSRCANLCLQIWWKKNLFETYTSSGTSECRIRIL